MPEDPPDRNVVLFPAHTRYLGPTLPEKCWRHGFKEFRDAHAEATEACDEFLFNAYLVGLGCVIGRNMNIKSSFNVHANIYSVNVGASGKSRKTTAQNFLISALRRVGTSTYTLHGLSSPEGLISVLSVNPKVLVILNEIKSFFIKGSQDSTRGLIPKLTELYDCPPEVSIPTKHNPTTAEKPFVCMIASTTREWFQNSIDPDDIRGGLAGRFMYFIGRDKVPNPWPSPPEEMLLEEAVQTMFAVGTFHSEPRIYEPSARARAVYDPWYKATREHESGHELLDAIGQRLHAHAMKLAMIYAALDGTDEISGDHMEAAVAFADYQREVHRHVVTGIGDSKTVKDEDRVVASFKRHGYQSPREVQQRVKGLNAKQTREILFNLSEIGRLSKPRASDGRYGPVAEV